MIEADPSEHTDMSSAPSAPVCDIAFIGLGTMGGPMAGHLWRAGHRLCVYNRHPQRRIAWQQAHPGSRVADSPAAAAAGAEIVCLCVGDDQAVEEVLFSGNGASSTLAAGAIVIDHSTLSAQQARRCHARLAERGIAYLDAPVSGGEPGARAGTLTLMAGGSLDAWRRAEPILTCYARHRHHMGDSGSGQMTKMVNQICVAGLLQSLAEAIHFAAAAGLDHDAVFAAITQGAASSWQMQHRHDSMHRGDYAHGFAVDWLRKDLGLCLDEARRSGATLPVTALVDQFLADLQNRGHGRSDMSSLLTRLQRGNTP